MWNMGSPSQRVGSINSSLTRARTQGLCVWEHRVLATGLPGKPSPSSLLFHDLIAHSGVRRPLWKVRLTGLPVKVLHTSSGPSSTQPVLKALFQKPTLSAPAVSLGSRSVHGHKPPRPASSLLRVAPAGTGCGVSMSREPANGSSGTGVNDVKAGRTVLLMEERLGRSVWG